MNWEKHSWGFSTDNAQFSLKLSWKNAELELSGELVAHVAPSAFDQNQFMEALNALELSGHIDYDNAMKFCRQVQDEGKARDIVLLRGTPAVPGRNGQVKLLVVAAPGTRIVNVVSGQVIAQLLPPTSGVAGMTLTGTSIPAVAGTPGEVTLGTGVQWHGGTPEAGEGEIVATVDGRMVYDPAAHTLRVDDRMVIEGNVGTRTGDIDFIGSVEIRGEVEVGRRIKAGKNIKISGNVESAFIEAGGNVEIGGGVSGKESGIVRAGGNIAARYVDICNIECKGNLVVKKEIVDSNVMVGGWIDVSGGVIIGGRLMALNGIAAQVIGSPIGVITVVISGQHYLAERKIAELEAEKEQLSKTLEELGKKLDPFVKNAVAIGFLTGTEKQELEDWSRQFTEQGARKERIDVEITAIRKRIAERANPSVSVGRMIAHNVLESLEL